MTMKDLTERFGPTGAQALVDHKLADKELAESEVRYHPSAPKVEAFNSSILALSLGTEAVLGAGLGEGDRSTRRDGVQVVCCC